MASELRAIRRLAFQGLYELDARAVESRGELEASLASTAEEASPELRAPKVERAAELAWSAYEARRASDALVGELAPEWPVHRRPAVDRAILRLAVFEMTSGRVPVKVAVNEAVELAKRFSTDRSPAFVNGVLDRIMRSLRERGEDGAEAGAVAGGDGAQSATGDVGGHAGNGAREEAAGGEGGKR